MLRIDQPFISDLMQTPSPLPDSGTETTAFSPLALAQAELIEYEDGALEETMENLGFAMGGRLGGRRGKGGDDEPVRTQVLMQKLVAEVAAVEAVGLEHLLSDSREWQQSPQLLTSLLALHPEPGQAALRLAAWLAHGRPNARLRSKMEEALSTLAADESQALSLFCALEFGVATPGLQQELKRLYHRASDRRQSLSQWLSMLGEKAERKKKLKTMIKVLSYELSASGQPIVGNHLAAVIGDLQQLLLILGVESYCDEIAAMLALQAMTGETFLSLVVTLSEQIWINADGIAEMIFPQNNIEGYRITQALSKLLQLLPDDCFTDPEHKSQIEEAVINLRDSYLS